MNKNNTFIDTNASVKQFNTTFEKQSAYLGRSISNYHELYQQESIFSDGRKIKSFPHLIGLKEDELKIISYDNSNGTEQLSLAKAMGKRRIAISIKHHAQKASDDSLEIMKLQCSHAQLVVRSGADVLTLNNPQSYEEGLFGDESYPMIFLMPNYQIEMSEEKVLAYDKNIIAWASLINTYSHFPGDYNGGDPLTAKNLKEAHYFGKKVLDAFLGNADAIEWLKLEDNKLYCAEMVFLALTLGSTFPLTEKFLSLELVSSLRKAFQDKRLSLVNENPQFTKLNIDLPDSSLMPLRLVSEEVINNGFGDGLAIQPMLVSDMITSYIKNTVPRRELGESCGKYQVELLQKSKQFLNMFLPHQEIQNSSSKINSLISKLEIVLGSEHGSYLAFQTTLKAILSEIDNEVARISSASNMFIPPHAFLVRAIENKVENRVKGIFAIDYLGHGVHQSLTQGEV